MNLKRGRMKEEKGKRRKKRFPIRREREGKLAAHLRIFSTEQKNLEKKSMEEGNKEGRKKSCLLPSDFKKGKSARAT